MKAKELVSKLFDAGKDVDVFVVYRHSGSMGCCDFKVTYDPSFFGEDAVLLELPEYESDILINSDYWRADENPDEAGWYTVTTERELDHKPVREVSYFAKWNGQQWEVGYGQKVIAWKFPEEPYEQRNQSGPQA